MSGYREGNERSDAARATAPEAAPEVDAFLAAVRDDLRTALLALRRTIAAAAPEAVEGIAYGVPAFTYRGRPLVSFSAGRNGNGPCSFYVQSPALMETFRDALKPYETGKGTIHFWPAEPLPEDLVMRIVQARMAEADGARRRRARSLD